MIHFSFRATHYLQYTDAASFTWRKRPDKVFHTKYASSRPHRKYMWAVSAGNLKNPARGLKDHDNKRLKMSKQAC